MKGSLGKQSKFSWEPGRATDLDWLRWYDHSLATGQTKNKSSER